MSQKLYLIMSGVVFLVVGVIHLVRLINHVPVMVGATEVPMATIVRRFSGRPCPLYLGVELAQSRTVARGSAVGCWYSCEPADVGICRARIRSVMPGSVGHP